ncbi:MAG: gliding motility-associated protein GldE, partial [Bacteroidales bacterium]|nr:gliding motility-associated protein GldE [Bacteroidales bacterium]
QMFDFSSEPVWGFVIETVVITFLLLLFGEIMPKIVATRYPIQICKNGSGPLLVLGKILKPIDVVLIKSTSLLKGRMRHHHNENLSMDELQTALEITSSSLIEDKEILEGIVRFGNIDARSIMTSRLDMETIELHSDFQTVLKNVEEMGYSRVPIYDKTPDNIKGILYIKDLIPHLNKGNTFRWQTLIRPATFVPETRKIDDLLEDFQKLHVHIAIVVDEFGGTLGLVTLEDVLEEIVGDISDEYDEEEQLYTKIDEHTYEFEAKIQLNDFFKITEIEPEELGDAATEAETLAGLLLYLAEDMPKQREHIVLGPCEFIVLSVSKRRILKVKVIVNRQ